MVRFRQLSKAHGVLFLEANVPGSVSDPVDSSVAAITHVLAKGDQHLPRSFPLIRLARYPCRCILEDASLYHLHLESNLDPSQNGFCLINPVPLLR